MSDWVCLILRDREWKRVQSGQCGFNRIHFTTIIYGGRRVAAAITGEFCFVPKALVPGWERLPIRCDITAGEQK
jgi:hypothetical protein